MFCNNYSVIKAMFCFPYTRLLFSELLSNLFPGQSTKVTVFAPVDHAFAVYRNSLLRPGGQNATYIYGGES